VGFSRYATLSEIIIGQVVHGRGGSALPGMETVLGPCINFLPIRISLGQKSTVADLLQHIQDQQLATVPHDQLSLKHIVSKCTNWPTNTKLGCIVHHQGVGAQPTSSDGSMAIGGVESTSSTSWANSTPVPGQVGIISIERGSSLDLYMTFPDSGNRKVRRGGVGTRDCAYNRALLDVSGLRPGYLDSGRCCLQSFFGDIWVSAGIRTISELANLVLG
jgi:hypothetical protein